MAEHNLVLNVINFFPEEDKKTFTFYTEKKDGCFPIAKYEFPKNIDKKFTEEELKDIEHLYTDFTTDSEAENTLTVDLSESKNFAKHYYNFLIHQFFKQKGLITGSNFVHDTEVWIENKKESNKDFTAYTNFVLKVQISRVSKHPELVLSFDGVSKVFNKSVEELDFDTQLYKWCLYNNSLYLYDELPDEARYEYNKVFPKLNRNLANAMGLPFTPKKIKNKYKNYYDFIAEFYEDYINKADFKEIIPTDKKGFLKVANEKINSTSYGSNTLIFGNEKVNANPYFGIQDGGPFELPQGVHFKFIYIFHESDKPLVNELKQWFAGNREGFDGIKKYVRLNYSGDNDNSIIFNDLENPIEEIREKLATKTFDEKVSYIAIYLSPFNKDEPDETKHRLYYLVKEVLLKYRITSQVIEKETLSEVGFPTSLKNIAVAIVAKLKGVPWLLKSEIKPELIVGIGAFKSTTFNERFIGSSFCFSNNGQFKGFDCHSEADSHMLAGSIEKAVRKYYNENKHIKRLIIHFYKEMSNDELKPILATLTGLGFDIPVFIVTVNKTESKEYVVFDENFEGKIPISGTFVNIGWNHFLLCNNTRYKSSVVSKIDSFPFPVRIKIKCTKEGELDNYNTVKELVDQVYQFSRMYWKSVRQQNLPVTIKYPEMVAQIYPYFDDPVIPPFGLDNLWFL